MKKIFTILLSLLLLFSLSGCDIHKDCGEYFQADLDDSYEEGYDEGYDVGYDEGGLAAMDLIEDEFPDLESYQWMMDNIVFTTRTGECYHKITCHYVENTQVWVYFTNGAEDEGYRPCSYCLGGYYEP